LGRRQVGHRPLFGSRVQGDHRPDSDVDVFVQLWVLKNLGPRSLEQIAQIRIARGRDGPSFRYEATWDAVYPFRFFAEGGGLLAYGVDLSDNFRRAASYADRILKGEKPGELPVQGPAKFEFVINLKTAKVLGLTVPPTLLARADEVTE
jgi:ABC transporter substrate binding protein/Nucleotidyltransferase domain